ncbi:shufflon system plasmid conjugative transfer pilus tip adhesin PilV [Acidithiobacillus thiooxidans]|uniref:shufflon system plasmid conjugative transfer pilus tip adhesin PilV n=1 Tax=Acidithiobacillus thiooxidans TaxID=930 RepID=UPI001C06E630|nr:shufflon system plasmid conjugative transfer pilus tip adhesin PilV [Acidithiobacillus thiooxidans]MBU2794467.1 shufflon system plasmid conjugative transfer pilus tip adhesin PilV [Acidithiobacillus thiooxidans]
MNPIAVLFAVIISALAVPAVYTAMSSQQQQELSTAAAIQMARVEKAAEAYITANAGAIESVATGSSPAVITVPMLESTGYLPNGFNSVNPFGQTWEVQVLQPSSGNLQALVVSYGGNTVKAKVAGQVAQIAGASGGVIGGGSGEYAVPGCGGGEACGAYDGWSVTTSGYQNIQPGHFAALLAYSNGQLQSDYLYRVAVPGQPQLNTMQTNLNMGANNINNAQNVNVNQNVEAGPAGQCVGDADGHCTGEIEAAGTTEADLPSGWQGGMTTRDLMGVNGTLAEGPQGSPQAYMSDYGNGSAGGGGLMTVVDPANGNYAVMNSANTGATPEIYTNGVIDGNTFGGNGYAMYNGSWWANNAGDSSQSGNAYVGGQVTANYDARLGTANGTANQNWGCSEYGEIAASASGNGQAMMCNGSSWQPMGGMTGYNQVAMETIPGNGSSNFGIWEFCSITGHQGQGADELVPVAGPYVVGNHYAWDWDGGGSGTNNTPVTCWNNN